MSCVSNNKPLCRDGYQVRLASVQATDQHGKPLLEERNGKRVAVMRPARVKDACPICNVNGEDLGEVDELGLTKRDRKEFHESLQPTPKPAKVRQEKMFDLHHDD